MLRLFLFDELQDALEPFKERERLSSVAMRELVMPEGSGPYTAESPHVSMFYYRKRGVLFLFIGFALQMAGDILGSGLLRAQGFPALHNLSVIASARAGLLGYLEVGHWGLFSEIGRRRGPHSISLRTRAGRSVACVAQRVISGFIQTLDFAAVEACIPDFKPSTEGFGCPQALNRVADGLGRCSEAPIFFTLVAKSLRQEQFGGCFVVEGRALALQCETKVHATLRSSLSLATRS